MRWAGGKLVPAGGERDEQAEYFARHFSEHYEEYAKENRIYGELKRLAQIYALAKWMKQAGIEMDSRWFDSLAPQPFETPRTTPSIANAVSHQWKTGSATRTETNSVFGGTDLGAKVAFKVGDPRANVFAEAVLQASAASGGQTVAELILDGRPQKAIALPITVQPDYGSLQTSSLDLSVITPGGASILLRRSYTSYVTASAEFGRGWSLLLPRLRFAGVTEKGKMQKISVEERPDTSVTLQKFHMTDDFGVLTQRFSNHFVDQDWKRIGFMPDGPSRRYRAIYPNADGTYSLVFARGDEWRFDAQGNLEAVRSGPASVEYLRDVTGRLVGLTSGGAWIKLHYDSHDRIDGATSSRGTQVRYAYDSEGCLAATGVNGRKVTYRYDQGHRLIQLAINDAPVLRNEYDDAGRLTRQLDGAGRVIQSQKVEETRDGGRRIVWIIGKRMITATYDHRLRPLAARGESQKTVFIEKV